MSNNSKAELYQYISDNLYDIIGYSTDIITEYICSSILHCNTLHDIRSIIQPQLTTTTTGNNNNHTIDKFVHKCHELVQRYKQSVRSSTTNSTAQLRALHQRNHSYQLVDDSNDTIDAELINQSIQLERAKRKAERKAARRAEKLLQAANNDIVNNNNNNNNNSDNHYHESDHIESIVSGDSSTSAVQLSVDEHTGLDRANDKKQRDEFHERMIAKQQSKSSHDNQSSHHTNTTHSITIDELRKLSRIEYLNKRELQQIEQSKRILAKECELLPDSQLNAHELRQRQYQRKLLQLVDDRRNHIDTAQHIQYYNIPKPTYESSNGKIDYTQRDEILTDKRDKNKKRNKHNDYSEFELQQRTMANYNVGTKSDDKQPEYDYVFDTSNTAAIDFIKSESISGTLNNQSNINTADPTDQPVQLTKHQQILLERKKLPIYPYRDQLLQAIHDYQIMIIVGETGSGKTTQIMQYLYESGYCNNDKLLGCTQPRRVAAMSVAARVSDEMNTTCGQLVGYNIRFEDNTSELTRIKYMTDGMLLREFLTSPDLANYNVIMIDEAHERTLHTDILFGLIKDIAKYRTDIKILISSATLDAEKFSIYFNNAPIFIIPGRRYPVDIYYTKQPEADYIDAVIVTCLQIHSTQPIDSGDILVFLTGQDEIEQCDELLQQRIKLLGNKINQLLICPIYSTLPTDMQTRIFEPAPKNTRKIILATNIAETSLTINGIVYVIDPGFVKQKLYNPRTSMESLVVVPISRASANQRAGRAGRISSGKCFRLYTAYAYATELAENTVPEIQRTNLVTIVLQLKSLGIDDIVNFDYMDPPAPDTLIRALEQLYALNALNDTGELTKLGRQMAELPLDPMLAKTLISSVKYQCTNSIITICSMLSLSNTIFYTPKSKRLESDTAHQLFYSSYGDMLTLLNVYNTWRDNDYSTEWCYQYYVQYRSMKKIRDIRTQLINMLSRIEIEYDDGVEEKIDEINICKCILSGFFQNTVKLDQQGKYTTLNSSKLNVTVYPGSVLNKSKSDDTSVLSEYLCYHELIETKKIFIRNVIQINGEWFKECCQHFYVPSTKKKKINSIV